MKADWETLKRARSGDEGSWQSLWSDHQPRLVAMAYFITGSRATAEDIAQETLLRALAARVKNQNGTVGGYLSTVAYRMALKEVKRLSRVVDLSGIETEDRRELPLEELVRNEETRILAESITTLSSDHRTALALRFYGELSYEDIAEILGIPVGTARSRVFYAVKACRGKLRQKGLTR